MGFESFVEQYQQSVKYAPLTVDVLPQIRAIAHTALQNALITDKEIRAVCPFHANSGSSLTLRINLDPTNRLGIGFTKCYSCGTHVHFNKLAEHLGIESLKGDANPELRYKIQAQNVKTEVEYQYRGVSMYKRRPLPLDYVWKRSDGIISRFALEVVQAELWDRQQMVPVFENVSTKNGVSRKIVNGPDGKPLVDYYADELRIFLPVLDRGEIVAHVAALDGKREWYSKKYLNSAGSWPKKYIAFFEQVVRAFPRNETLVVVEGPADSLRLIDFEISAVPNLGGNAWSRSKAEMVSSKFSRVLLMTDSDETGTRIKKQIKSVFSDLIPVYTVKTPRGIKDPAAMSNSQIINFKSKVVGD